MVIPPSILMDLARSSTTPLPTLTQPSTKKKNREAAKTSSRLLRNVFRLLPIIAPAACRFPYLPGGPATKIIISGVRVTATLFGYRRGRVTLLVQQNPSTMPKAVMELSMQTQALHKEMTLGMVRIALECEKRPAAKKVELLEEPLWTMFCNGKKLGCGVRRETTKEDMRVMEALKAVSMGAGVLSGRSDTEGPDGEMTYIRSDFDRVVGSQDSETLYMACPYGSIGPELTIFFGRV